MSDLTEIERRVLKLPPREREQVALAAWESLARDPEQGAEIIRDDEGMDIARRRDEEIDSGTTQTLSHEEFTRRTSRAE